MYSTNSNDRMANPAAVIPNSNNNNAQNELATPTNLTCSTGHSHSQQYAQLSSPTALTEETSEISSSLQTIMLSTDVTSTSSTNTNETTGIIDSTTPTTTTTLKEQNVTTRFFTAAEQETQFQLNSRHGIDHIVSRVAPSSIVSSSNIVQINSLSPLPAVTVLASSSSSSSLSTLSVSSSQSKSNIFETKKCIFAKNNNLVNKNNGNKSNSDSIGVNKYTKLSERNKISVDGGSNNNNNNNKTNNINSNNTTMVAMHDMVNEENFSFDDTSEELQYGPGIVSKLRCRYLSLALRQSSNKQRPSLDNLRRATSLNNLLDEDEDNSNGSNRTSWNNHCGDTIREQKARTPDEYVMSFVRKDSSNDSNRCRQVSRGNDSLKRARSVEALMRYDNKAWQRDISKDSNENDDDIIHHQQQQSPVDTLLKSKRAGNNDVIVSIEDKIVNARERGEHKPKRLTSFMDETERPPPDLVKHTLRLFEATANRRTINSRLGNGDVAAKVATFKSIISQEKPANIFPKPPLSPKKPMTKPRSNITSSPIKQNLTNSNGNNIINGGGGGGGNSNSSVVKSSVDIQSIKMNLEKSTNGAPTTTTTNGFSNGVKKLPDYCRSPSPSLALRIENANAYRTSKLDSPLSPQLVLKTNASVSRPHLDFSHISSPSIIAQQQQQRIDVCSPDLLKGRNVSSDSELTPLAKKFESMSIESQQKPIYEPLKNDNIPSSSTSTNHIVETDSIDDGDCTSSLKHISKIALANISKAGTTTEFKFSSTGMNKSHLPGLYNGSNLPAKKFTDISEPNVRQIGIIRPQVKSTVTSPIPPPRQSPSVESPRFSDSFNNIETHNIPTTNTNINVNASEINKQQDLEKLKRDNLLITNLLMTNNSSNNQVSALTSREIEKNLINKEKNEEVKWQTVGGGTVGQTTVTKLSSSSPSQKNWQNSDVHNNSMVFNFSNRKNIPDYIENDGLVFRRKRELPKVSKKKKMFILFLIKYVYQ